MPETRDFGPLAHIVPEAIGQPGQRRFRLLALSDEGASACLWLEKEQLSALGEAIENVLKSEGFEYQAQPLDDLPLEPVFPLNPSVEMRLAQLSMGIDRDNRAVVLIAADGADDEDSTTSVTMNIDYGKGFELRRRITEVVAAGRPPCPLCTAPMDPAGHVCVRTNGHNPH
jgi:uncharacterized repeat protein (TIGR03847 family)